MRLSSRLTLIYSLVTVIPGLFVGYFSYRISEQALVSEVAKLTTNNLAMVSDRIDNYLQTWKNNLYLLSNNKAVMHDLFDDFSYSGALTIDYYRDMNDLVQGLYETEKITPNPKQSNIEIYCNNDTLVKDGYLIKDINQFNADNMTWREAFQSKDDYFWSGPEKMAAPAIPDAPQDIYVIPLCKKLFSNQSLDEFGFIKVYIPISNISGELSMLSLPDNGWCCFLDAGQNIIYQKNPNNMVPSELDGALAAKDGAFPISTGKDMVFLSNIPSNGGSIVLSFPKSYLQDMVFGIINVTWVIVILSIGLASAISYLAARLVTGRLVHFVENIRNVARKEVPAHLEILGRDEIGTLELEFNQMVDRLNQLLEEKYQASIRKNVLEMELLQYQFNPHFLYNVLSSIKWVANDMGAGIIGDTVDSLVKLFRMSLNSGDEVVKIETELEIVREYVNIHLFIYDDRFRVEYDISPDIMQMYTIKLILQPIVENAILHGLLERGGGSGVITIAGAIEEGDIYFRIEDNGPGIDEEALAQLNGRNENKKIRKGYGLRNIQERISLFFGEPYGLSILSKKNEGTCVTVRLPLCSREEMDDRLYKFL